MPVVVHGGGGGDFAKGQFRRENFACQISDQNFPSRKFPLACLMAVHQNWRCDEVFPWRSFPHRSCPQAKPPPPPLLYESTLALQARQANFPLIFPRFPPFSAFFVPALGTRCCLKTDILMLLSHWGYGIFGFSPFFTHCLLISTTSIPFSVDLSPLWGPREGRGDVAILIYPRYGDPEKAGAM